MTRAHRRLHLVAWLTLTPIILALLVAAMISKVRIQHMGSVARQGSVHR